eukprot:gene23275-27913_t
MEYGGFWRRVGAFFIDMAIMLPLVLPLVYLGLPRSQSFLLYWFLPSLALNLGYNVYLVNRFGGTPGQLLCKLRVRMLDGAPVTRQAALLRHAVLLALTILSAIAGIIGRVSADAVHTDIRAHGRPQAKLGRDRRYLDADVDSQRIRGAII